MTPAERVIAYFDRISEAPDAIPRLRRFVLELAVRGRLTEPRTDDEPIAKLWEALHSQRNGQAARPQTRRRPSQSTDSEDSGPFTLPEHWRWGRLAQIASFSAGRTPSRHESSFWNPGDHAWVTIADMQDGQVLTTTNESVSSKALERVFGGEPEPTGTMLMSFKLTIGKMARLGISAFHNEAIVSIRPFVPGMDPYLFRVLPQFARQGATKGAIKGATLNRESISNILIPLPPLAEQHRIVAKVDELMTLCDRLEAAQKERENRRDRLVIASSAWLEQTTDTTWGEHAERYLKHLLPLLTNRHRVQRLRQHLITLALRGQLTVQASSEAACSPAVRRGGESREALSDEDNQSSINGLPANWRWVRLREITQEMRYGTSVKCTSEDKSGVPVLRIPNVANGRVNVDELKFGRLPSKLAATLRLQLDDVLIIRSNGSLNLVGRPALVTELGVGMCYAGYLVRVRTNSKCVLNSYLIVALNSSGVRDQIEVPIRSTVGLKNVNASELGDLAFALPPLPEQARIVTKLGELNTLCDLLEAQLETGRAAQAALLEATLRQALENGAPTQLTV